tara:strand:+ start:3052 stop:3279 length:228 start_codon:yes stop_codon:yes gene_type:complete
MSEKDLIDMADDFKNRIKEKNNEIAELKKFIISMYGMIRYADENNDLHLIELVRGALSTIVCEMCDIEIEDLNNN